MIDFDHLTDEELEAQIVETEKDERRRRTEARKAEIAARGKMVGWEITARRLNDEITELRRRKNG
jgi:hypothetical protein